MILQFAEPYLLMRFFVCIFIFVSSFSNAQNLVPNYSFETYSICPNSSGQVESAVPWTAATTNSSTDYFNICSPVYSVPRHPAGFQYAKTGNAYVGLFLIQQPYTDAREYLQVQLTAPLIQDKSYYVKFYINLRNGIAYYPCNNVAANFSVLRPSAAFGVLQSLSPHIMNPGNPVIGDTLNWTKVSGCYTAQGGEEYLTIGNFMDDANTQTTGTGTNTASYYYVDDVLVEEVTGNCTTGINELALENTVSLLPNPVNDLLSINSAYEINKIELSNIAGQLLLSEPVNSKIHQLQLQRFEAGIYFVKCTYANGMSLTKKLVVNR